MIIIRPRITIRSWRINRQNMKQRGQKVNEIKQFQDKLNMLSDKEKEAKKSEFENKIKALQEYDRQKQTDLRKEFNDKKTEIAKDVETAIESTL